MTISQLILKLRAYARDVRTPPLRRPACQSENRLRKEAKWKLRAELLKHSIYQRTTRAQQRGFGLGVGNKARRHAAAVAA